MRDCYCHGMLWFPLKFSLLALFSLSCSPLIATPQVLNVPNAGAISNEIRQTTIEPLNAPEETDIKLPQLNKPTPPEGGLATERITLHRVRFEGDVSLFQPGITADNKDLQALITPWLNRSLTFNDLQAMTFAVTRFYRKKGWVAAQAILPPQTIRDGIIVVRVIAGRLDKPQINNQSSLNSHFITTVIESNSCSKKMGSLVIKIVPHLPLNYLALNARR
ncbi:POTRA domain-containing protein, ShlB-type [Yersinia pestis KIM D27]|nr:POTRA domain-containing protein, ShlB-type [Yersinia pestis KIM D27]